MAITNQQASKLNQQRLDEGNRAEAEAYRAKRDAVAAHAFWRFSLKHSGQSGLQHGEYLSNEANDNMLLGWIEQQQDTSITEQSLEAAYAACYQMLAHRSGRYERKTNLQESRHMPQIKDLRPAPPPLVLPYTRKQILRWSPERLQQEMKKSPEHIEALNRILAGN